MLRRLRWVVAVLVVGVACGPEAGPGSAGAQAAVAGAIINGTADTTDTAVVALTYGGEEFCSGTLVSSRTVFTAGHCVRESGYTASEIKVFFGNVVGGAGTSIKATAFEAHPKWYSDSSGIPYYDVAYVTLASDAPVAPMAWQSTALPNIVGKSTTMVGYGVTNANQQTGDGTRRETTQTISSQDSGFIYYGNGSSGTCQGDSGGPTFLAQNGVRTLIAVTSYGDETCVQQGANTRVDTYATWLSGVVTGTTTCGNGTCDAGETNANCPADCKPVCGNSVCETGENNLTCPADCQPVCGNGVCETGETNATCAKDCKAVCGNGTCETGETNATCAADCPPVCGNAVCETGETKLNCAVDCDTDGTLWLACSASGACPTGQACYGSDQTVLTNDFCSRTCTATSDCPTSFSCASIGGTSICQPVVAVCGNGTCDAGETNANCPADCPAVCGNGLCETGETKVSCAVDCDTDGTLWEPCSVDGGCPVGQSCYGSDQSDFTNDFCSKTCKAAGDCPTAFSCQSIGGGTSICTPTPGGPVCGNGTCEAGETTASCPADCPAPAAVCGNGTCEAGETTASCPADCPATSKSVCGNGICEEGEDVMCPSDCPSDPVGDTGTGKADAATATCGNGVCDGGETCSTCPADCGACSGQPDAVGPDGTSGSPAGASSGSGGGCAAAPGFPGGSGAAPALLLLGLVLALRRRAA
jgi:V8-like Glu-specific endopeptidase